MVVQTPNGFTLDNSALRLPRSRRERGRLQRRPSLSISYLINVTVPTKRRVERSLRKHRIKSSNRRFFMHAPFRKQRTTVLNHLHGERPIWQRRRHGVRRRRKRRRENRKSLKNYERKVNSKLVLYRKRRTSIDRQTPALVGRYALATLLADKAYVILELCTR